MRLWMLLKEHAKGSLVVRTALAPGADPPGAFRSSFPMDARPHDPRL
jgi:hypothetical protein